MRSTCRVLFAFLLLSCVVQAKAVTITAQDPPPELITPPAQFSFESCSGYFFNGSQVSADGCYQFENETGSDITSLTLSFAPLAPGVDTSKGQTAKSDIWSSLGADCSSGTCIFTYADGELNDNANLLLTEVGVKDLSQFGPVTVNFTTAATTPEPSSFLLLATGLFGVGGFSFQRRRA